MSVGIPITGGTGRIGPPPAVDRQPPPTSPPRAGDSSFLAAAPGPPPEVSAEVREAARRADQLREQGRQLRFESDSASGRIRVEVRDLDGNLVRRIPLTELLDVVRGKPVG